MGRYYAEVRFNELAKIADGNITPEALITAGLVPTQTQTVKIILSGSVEKAVNVSGCRVTKGAKAAIEAAGGSVAALPEPASKAKLVKKNKQA